MSARPEGPIELAMAFTVGANGQRVKCERPMEIRAIAAQLHGWRDSPATCESCVAATATWLVRGERLCPLCKSQRAMRMEGMERLEPQQWSRRDVVSGQGFEGHAIVTNELSVDLGGFRERIMPQALNRTFKENLDVLGLWNHDSSFALGRMSAGTLDIWKDKRGLMIALVPPSWAITHLETVGRGDVTGQSFGFSVLDDEWFMDQDMPIRHVTDMRVRETSIVAFPAYPQTDVKVKKDMRAQPENRVEFLSKQLGLARAR